MQSKFVVIFLILGCLSTITAHADEATDLGQDYSYHDLAYENIRDVLPAVWMQHGKELYNLGKWEQAAQVFKRVLSVEPGQAEARRYLESIHAKNENISVPVEIPQKKSMGQSQEKISSEENNLGFIKREQRPMPVAPQVPAPEDETFEADRWEDVDDEDQEDVPLDLNDQERETIEKKTPQMDQGKKKVWFPY